MSKRFTDTDKWKREWFCDLDVKAKVVWFYLLDQCDHRGVWFRNFKLMSDQVGFQVKDEDFINWFGLKIQLFDEDKYFIKSFVDFQYGELKESNNAHKAIISLIEKLKNEVLISPSQGAQDKDKDKDKDIIILKEEKKTKIDLKSAYNLYRLKKGKSKGLQKLQKEIKTDIDFENLKKAIKNYNTDIDINKTEFRYIMHFSTFVSEWQDWVDYQQPIGPHRGTFENARADIVDDFNDEIRKLNEPNKPDDPKEPK